MVFLIFILEIAAGIYAYTRKADVQKDLKENLVKAMQNSYGGNTTADKALTEAVDWFEENVRFAICS